jgi:hypothetical protein
MKKILVLFLAGIAIIGTSCKKYLDINKNPNNATSATANLILPQALRGTASVLNSFNTYGSETGLYSANAGGYGGFGELITYNYTSTGTGLWNLTYNNLEDYQTIINYTNDQRPLNNYYNAAARIMKVHGFQLLVDAFNNIPYSAALNGADNLTPVFDDAKAIYASLATELDSAIAIIHDGMNATGTVNDMGNTDILFGGNMTKWLQFANTLKLRLMIRGKGNVTFTNTSFDAAGFLTTDALINPGFTRDNGKQNPAWETWAYGYTGSAANKAWEPSTFVFGFYDGHTLNDSWRGSASFYQFPTTGTNRLGIESNSLISCPTGSFWYSGTNRDGKSNGNQVGILKGPDAGYPIMLAAESYFLQAEGRLNGLLTSGPTTDVLFNNGISASFNYLYQLPDGSVSGNPAADAAAYMAANSTSRLVNFSLATTDAQKLEAIITQKFIALDFINGHEGWNEYRRTHYPTIVPGTNPYQTFASTVSESTRADKLPTRILYPTTEASYNPENTPTGISPFTSLIFWAKP